MYSVLYEAQRQRGKPGTAQCNCGYMHDFTRPPLSLIPTAPAGSGLGGVLRPAAGDARSGRFHKAKRYAYRCLVWILTVARFDKTDGSYNSGRHLLRA